MRYAPSAVFVYTHPRQRAGRPSGPFEHELKSTKIVSARKSVRPFVTSRGHNKPDRSALSKSASLVVCNRRKVRMDRTAGLDVPSGLMSATSSHLDVLHHAELAATLLDCIIANVRSRAWHNPLMRCLQVITSAVNHHQVVTESVKGLTSHIMS